MMGSGYFEDVRNVEPGAAFRIAPEIARNAAELVVARECGLGDLVLLLPALRELAVRFPDLRVTLATADRYAATMGAPFLHRVIPYHDADPNTYRVVNLQEYPERHPRNGTIERVLLFGMGLGITPKPPPVPVVVRQDLLEDSLRQLERAGWRAGEPVVAFVASGSTPIRAHDPTHAHETTRLLARAGAWVLVLHPGPLSWPREPRVLDLTGRTSVPESVAWVALADCTVSPDTGLAHVAGSLRRPLVAVFTTWSSALRLTWYDAVALEPAGLSCHPCNDRGCGGWWCTAWTRPEAVCSAVAEVLAPRWALPLVMEEWDHPVNVRRYGAPRTPEVLEDALRIRSRDAGSRGPVPVHALG